MLTLRHSLLIGLLTGAGLLPAATARAQAGKNGALVVSGPNVVVNQYTALATDAAAGAVSLTVASTTSLSPGDLVMVIQMQGASIDASNTAAYGTVTALGNTGNYELAVVQAVPNGTTLALSQGLTNAYSAAGKAQVVRIPRLTTVTVNSGASITGAAWNGSTGGVVALEAQGTVAVEGSITATGLGFRGGAFADNAVNNNSNYVGTGNVGGEKGEGIAGYGSSYPGGSRGRGAAANGGGGGNSVNAGGGGGANAGSLAEWTGRGNPSLATAAWATAWNLETAGFATATSSGGGRGGYAVSDNNLDALSVGPGQSAWGVYSRANTGGLGGRPLDYSTGRLFLGGGGGTGDGNTSVAGVGGRGGGLIYVVAPTLTGSGRVQANGAAGADSYANSDFADGAGGGGAGGTMVLAVDNLGALTVEANGGAGGNTYNTVVKGYGPGGGGGAGYIGLKSGVAVNGTALVLNGGAGGNSSSPGLTEFTPNGATAGGGNTVVLRTTSAVPLPVSWVSFGASREPARTRLSWTTAQEKNNAYFQPERSLDGQKFTSIGEPVAGAGTTQSARRYVAYDAQPPAGPAYYRIRQVDQDGTPHYSATVLVRGEAAAAAAYPNPVRRGELLRTGVPAGTVLQLTDVLGRTVAVPTAAGSVDTRGLQPGQYWLRAAGGQAQRITVVPE
jgi:hypothetical protein